MLQVSTLISHGIRSGSLLPELLGEPDENSFGTPDVAEPIHVFILDHFSDELRAGFAESGERIVDVLHGEHDAQVAESVHWGAAVIGDHRRREETRHLQSAVTVRRRSSTMPTLSIRLTGMMAPWRLTNERDFPEPATASRCQD